MKVQYKKIRFGPFGVTFIRIKMVYKALVEVYFYAPLWKRRAYCFAPVGRYVGRSVGMSVGRYVGIP